MGNWRRVLIVGTCDQADVPNLKKALDFNMYATESVEFHPLISGGGICGLPLWAAEQIEAVGNLAERDYSEEQVAAALRYLSSIAPSLKVRVHVGGDYEHENCAYTVRLENGEVEILRPEIEKIPAIPDAQMAQQFEALLKQQRGMI